MVAAETSEQASRWRCIAGRRSAKRPRWLVGRGRIGERLEVNSIAEIFKRVAAFVGMDPKEVSQVSGHSVRVATGKWRRT
jgi:hypothetical protein